jgi:hypothetical protein
MNSTENKNGSAASSARVEREPLMHRQRSAVAAKSVRRSYVTLPLGIRIHRRSLYAGSTSAALLFLLLMALCLYSLYQYDADLSDALKRVDPIPAEGRPTHVQQILDAAEQPQSSSADSEAETPVTVQSILEHDRAASGLDEREPMLFLWAPSCSA